VLHLLTHYNISKCAVAKFATARTTEL